MTVINVSLSGGFTDLKSRLVILDAFLREFRVFAYFRAEFAHGIRVGAKQSLLFIINTDKGVGDIIKVFC